MVYEQAAGKSNGGLTIGDDEVPVSQKEEAVAEVSTASKNATRKKDTQSPTNCVLQLLQRDLPEDKVTFWMEMVNRTFSAHISLLVEPSSGTTLRDNIEETDVCNIQGLAGSSYLGFLDSFSQACESVTPPSRRTAPYQEAHATKCLHAALEARIGSDNKR